MQQQHHHHHQLHEHQPLQESLEGESSYAQTPPAAQPWPCASGPDPHSNQDAWGLTYSQPDLHLNGPEAPGFTQSQPDLWSHPASHLTLGHPASQTLPQPCSTWPPRAMPPTHACPSPAHLPAHAGVAHAPCQLALLLRTALPLSVGHEPCGAASTGSLSSGLRSMPRVVIRDAGSLLLLSTWACGRQPLGAPTLGVHDLLALL